MRVGSEVMTYRASPATTGVPRVMKETHRHLTPLLAKPGWELVPVATSERSEYPGTEPNAYISSDPVLRLPLMSPEDVDVLLLIQASTTIDYARLLRIRRERDLPIIAMIHDIMPLTQPEWFVPQGSLNFRVMCQQILHVADHVIVPSQHVADGLTALQWSTDAQVHVMRLGTSFDQQPPHQTPGDVIQLVYVSTIEPRKGHHQLLDAFDALRAQGVDLTLTLVGRKGWCVDDLVTRISGHDEFGLSVRWVPDADDHEARTIVEGCSVAVIPTEDEGFGLFLEEALCAGVMVVARGIPVFRERPYPNVVFFDGNEQTLPEAILRAASLTPQPIAPGEVRTMRDFSDDLADLIVSTVAQQT